VTRQMGSAVDAERQRQAEHVTAAIRAAAAGTASLGPELLSRLDNPLSGLGTARTTH
jgi:hypothetical protein